MDERPGLLTPDSSRGRAAPGWGERCWFESHSGAGTTEYAAFIVSLYGQRRYQCPDFKKAFLGKENVHVSIRKFLPAPGRRVHSS